VGALVSVVFGLLDRLLGAVDDQRLSFGAADLRPAPMSNRRWTGPAMRWMARQMMLRSTRQKN